MIPKTSNPHGTPQDLLDSLDRPLSDLRISVTDRCNLRCPFCMPAEAFGGEYHFLPRAEILTFEEIVRIARIFIDLGISKIRLTGGEPLLRSEIEVLIAQLAVIGGVEDLALTTNGFLLAQKARALKEAGLQRVTVSLHSLDDKIFGMMNGRGHRTKEVLEGIDKAAEVGLTPIKINVVIKRGVNDHTIVELARFFKSSGHVVRFIEYMDAGNLNGWMLKDVVPADEIVSTIDAEMPLQRIEKDYPSEVALRYRYRDGSGEIGIIGSITRPFCGDCARIRLAADGKLYTCLFANVGFDLKGPLRARASDAELEGMIKGIWKNRIDRYSEERAELLGTRRRENKVEMYQLGG